MEVLHLSLASGVVDVREGWGGGAAGVVLAAAGVAGGGAGRCLVLARGRRRAGPAGGRRRAAVANAVGVLGWAGEGGLRGAVGHVPGGDPGGDGAAARGRGPARRGRREDRGGADPVPAGGGRRPGHAPGRGAPTGVT